MKYTVDYFIQKFEAIPEEKWHTGDYKDDYGTKFCALGHCGANNITQNEEADALCSMLGYMVPDINDGGYERYKQPTPKQRIIAALYDIKKMTNEPERERSVATGIISEQYPDITKTLAVLPEQKKEVDKIVLVVG